MCVSEADVCCHLSTGQITQQLAAYRRGDTKVCKHHRQGATALLLFMNLSLFSILFSASDVSTGVFLLLLLLFLSLFDTFFALSVFSSNFHVQAFVCVILFFLLCLLSSFTCSFAALYLAMWWIHHLHHSRLWGTKGAWHNMFMKHL